MAHPSGNSFYSSWSKSIGYRLADGILFDILNSRISYGIGIDPNLPYPIKKNHFELIQGWFPEDLENQNQFFDVITLLAVLEHIPSNRINEFSQACARVLKPSGCMVITVPSRKVDLILAFLHFWRIIDGMALEQHHGFEPMDLPNMFIKDGFEIATWKKFQLGFNNLIVFQRSMLNKGGDVSRRI
jgi:SAM-dependent methyltransferase